MRARLFNMTRGQLQPHTNYLGVQPIVLRWLWSTLDYRMQLESGAHTPKLMGGGQVL